MKDVVAEIAKRLNETLKLKCTHKCDQCTYKHDCMAYEPDEINKSR